MTSAALVTLLAGATRLLVAIDVAKHKMMAGFGHEDGTVCRLVRFESPTQTRAFVELVVQTGKALGVGVEALMEPTGTYGDGLRGSLSPPRQCGGWEASSGPAPRRTGRWPETTEIEGSTVQGGP